MRLIRKDAYRHSLDFGILALKVAMYVFYVLTDVSARPWGAAGHTSTERDQEVVLVRGVLGGA